MRPPIIADCRGDICVFDSVASAEGYIEAPDVHTGQWTVFDSEGRLLIPQVISEDYVSFIFFRGRRELVVLKPAETAPTHASDLRNRLLGFLSKTKFARAGMQGMSLAELIGIMPQEPSRKLRWT